jgi:hypothetical protein
MQRTVRRSTPKQLSKALFKQLLDLRHFTFNCIHCPRLLALDLKESPVKNCGLEAGEPLTSHAVKFHPSGEKLRFDEKFV